MFLQYYFVADDDHAKETNRLKQELYRFELSKQIEEKKRLELERKRQEQMEDEAIERTAREQDEKIKKEYEQEMEKRTLAQLQVLIISYIIMYLLAASCNLSNLCLLIDLQKQLQQEKLKNEIMQKQKELESKAWNAAQAETMSRQVSKHVPSRHESFVDHVEEEFQYPPQSTFDNVPLPTSRVRVPRKVFLMFSCSNGFFIYFFHYD